MSSWTSPSEKKSVIDQFDKDRESEHWKCTCGFNDTTQYYVQKHRDEAHKAETSIFNRVFGKKSMGLHHAQSDFVCTKCKTLVSCKTDCADETSDHQVHKYETWYCDKGRHATRNRPVQTRPRSSCDVCTPVTPPQTVNQFENSEPEY
jgi:hypothetical protein